MKNSILEFRRHNRMDFFSSSDEEEKGCSASERLDLTDSEEDLVDEAGQNINPTFKQSHETVKLENVAVIVEAMRKVAIGKTREATAASNKASTVVDVCTMDSDSSDDENFNDEVKPVFPATSKRRYVKESDENLKKKVVDLSMLPDDSDDGSSDDDELILKNHKPSFRKRSNTIELEDTDESSREDQRRTSISRETNRSKSDSRWRRSILSEEYTMVDPSNPEKVLFRVPTRLFKQLYKHQVDGVAWMFGLHCGGIGGLLGDDMGMGKTFQTLTFLGGMMRAGTIRNALILSPVSVLRSWEKEAKKIMNECDSSIRITVVGSHIQSNHRYQLLQKAVTCPFDRPQLVIASYGLARATPDSFLHETAAWDYMVFDEAQELKNRDTATSKNVRAIAENFKTHRLLLTGTPIKNYLKDLWVLMDFATLGKVLGPFTRFDAKYQKPIEHARERDASQYQIEKAELATKDLQEKLQPYLLQRLKIDHLKDKLPTKNELVVWTHLSPSQRHLYREYVNAKDSAVADVLTGIKSSPLIAITHLKKLCGHPILISDEEDFDMKSFSSESLQSHSSKLQVLHWLVSQLRNEKHRTLIFSYSTKMLDIIERVLEDSGCLVGRIDGKTKEQDRQTLVDRFNQNGSPLEIMLLSTKAAGVGLTLTGADRVILYDPGWSPADDSQAVDRCYRIGQTKPIVVYRLITAGTVEEKMYERQTHKDGIRRAAMSYASDNITRHYSTVELRQLFNLGPAGECDFLSRLLENKGVTGGEDSGIYHNGVVGVSSHDILYENKAAAAAPSRRRPDTKEPQERPFGSPSKPANINLQTVEAPCLEGRAFDTKPSGKSQRVLKMIEGKNNDDIPLKRTKSFSKAAAAGDDGYSNKDFGRMLKKVDILCNAGKREVALEVMMNAMESMLATLSQDQAMQLHHRMSSVGYDLRWL